MSSAESLERVARSWRRWCLGHVPVDGVDGYLHPHTARAELLRRLGRADEFRAAYERALELGPNEPERRVQLKTDAAVREGCGPPQLAAVLKEPRKMLLSHGLYRADAFGFVTANGGPLYCRNVAERGVEPPKAPETSAPQGGLRRR